MAPSQCNEDNELLEKTLKGVKLPKNKQQWDTANLYFQQHIPYNLDISDINEIIVEFQTTLYNYFKINFGTINSDSSELYKKYFKMSNWKLKKCRKIEKLKTPSNEAEIKYISKMLRSKFKNSHSFVNTSRDHHAEIDKNIFEML